MWCVPEIDEQYVRRMEQIFELLEEPVLNSEEPVIAVDERPVPLLADGDHRRVRRLAGPHVATARNNVRGVASAFAMVVPHEWRYLAHATRDKKGPTLPGR